MTKHTILFLAANPCGTDPRALDREARSIRAELKRSGYRDRFEFETRWAAEPLDLLRELRELRPTVVHFSGRGGQDGLFFQTAEGSAQVVAPAALAEAFGAAGASVKLVVLSACYSERSAEALLAHVGCVVGMGGSIHGDAARSFAIGFYGALGEQEPIETAYLHGKAAISLEGLSGFEHPQLKVRDGTDATKLVPAAAASPELVELPCPYPGCGPTRRPVVTDRLHDHLADVVGVSCR
jgi:CHAT domain-containing protein